MSRELGVVEDTLYVPMLGRIYASENCRNILHDGKALELKEKLPEEADIPASYKKAGGPGR